MPVANKHILVVDDCDASARLIEALLELDGYRVLIAHNGQQALALAAQQRVDLVLLDLVLPDMHGAQLALKLRSMATVACAHVLAISASDSPNDEMLARAAGIWSLTLKPIDTAKLRTLVGELLR